MDSIPQSPPTAQNVEATAAIFNCILIFFLFPADTQRLDRKDGNPLGRFEFGPDTQELSFVITLY